MHHAVGCRMKPRKTKQRQDLSKCLRMEKCLIRRFPFGSFPLKLFPETVQCLNRHRLYVSQPAGSVPMSGGCPVFYATAGLARQVYGWGCLHARQSSSTTYPALTDWIRLDRHHMRRVLCTFARVAMRVGKCVCVCLCVCMCVCVCVHVCDLL